MEKSNSTILSWKKVIWTLWGIWESGIPVIFCKIVCEKILVLKLKKIIICWHNRLMRWGRRRSCSQWRQLLWNMNVAHRSKQEQDAVSVAVTWTCDPSKLWSTRAENGLTVAFQNTSGHLSLDKSYFTTDVHLWKTRKWPNFQIYYMTSSNGTKVEWSGLNEAKNMTAATQ